MKLFIILILSMFMIACEGNFRYRDCVTVTEGLYKGCTGYVIGKIQILQLYPNYLIDLRCKNEDIGNQYIYNSYLEAKECK